MTQQYDWQALERSREFRELIARKRRFVVPATIGFLVWYIGFILLAGYAEDFMGSEFLVDGLTVGYVLAFSQFVMVWWLAWLYMRKADRVFDPLEARVRELALRHELTEEPGEPPVGTGRFTRGEPVAEPEPTKPAYMEGTRPEDSR